MKAAKNAGHEVTVWCTHKDALRNWHGNEPDIVYDGVTVKRVRNSILGIREVKQFHPDVLFSHHDHALLSVRSAKTMPGCRSVFATHNDMDLNRRPLGLKPDLVLYNSAWVRESLSRFGDVKASMTFHPPLTVDRHTVDATGDAVTLINLNEHKGANVFYDVARSMPDTPFLGVIGGHGEQVIRRDIPNVTIHPHSPDMKQVWSQTRVLLMPSVYESYGLTAVEAGINGIPTIANPTPGLMENLGPGGLFVDRDNHDGWVHEIRRLADANTYAEASFYARERATLALDSTRDTLKEWVAWIG